MKNPASGNAPGLPNHNLPDDGLFRFTPVQLRRPIDNLTTAIGLIQAEHLAATTEGDAEVMFGSYHFQQACLETAVAMLVALLPEMDNARWSDQPGGAGST